MEFKKLLLQLQRKRHIKIELCVQLKCFCNDSMLITLYKIGELHFPWLGTNGFHGKGKDVKDLHGGKPGQVKRASAFRRQNLKYENFTSSFSRLRQNFAPKSVPHVQHDYFSSFNQSNH